MARILIVEDEKNAREALGEVFSGMHDVHLAEDAESALEVILKKPLDLVLTDIVLPGPMDGLDLLEKARAAQFADLPPQDLGALISVLEDEMHAASADLRFEEAARLRDEVKELKRELRSAGG